MTRDWSPDDFRREYRREQLEPLRELAADPRDREWFEDQVCEPGYLLGLDPLFRVFMRDLVEKSKNDELGRSGAKERLAETWEQRPDELPWPTPAGVDFARIADVLVEDVWPSPWRVGRVNRSETHVLVRHAGVLDGEPEGVDIAVLAPDEDDRLIVEFLPMPGIDPESAQKQKRDAYWTTEMLVDGEPRGWRQVLRRCGSTGNAYGPLRYLHQFGKARLIHLPEENWIVRGSVAAQPKQVDGIGPLGHFVFENREGDVRIHLERDVHTIEGRLIEAHKDWLGVELRRPVPGGRVRRRVFEPFEDGFLLDDSGALTAHGLRTAVELMYEMHRAAFAMQGHLEEVRNALRRVREEILSSRPRIAPDKESWLRTLRRKMGKALPDAEPVLFDSVVGEWVTQELHGLRDPVTGNWGDGGF